MESRYGTVPVSLEPIEAFMKLADDIETNEENSCDLVAFCCRRYAAEKAMKSIKLETLEESDIVQGYLASVMDTLEEDKQLLQEKYRRAQTNHGWGGDVTKFQQLEIVSEYALLIYTQAQEELGHATATQETAKKFYKAAHLFEVAHENNIEFLVLQKKCQLKVNSLTVSN